MSLYWFYIVLQNKHYWISALIFWWMDRMNRL